MQKLVFGLVFLGLALTTVSAFRFPKIDLKNADCKLCELTMRLVQQELKSADAEERLLQYVEENVCSQLGTLNDTCVQLVQTEGKNILDDLVSRLTDVCQLVQLCPSKQNVKFELNAAGSCQLCEGVAVVVEDLLKQNKTDTEIISFVEKFCSVFPSALAPQCKSLIDQYGVYLIQLLLNDETPEKICQSLHFCP